MKYKNIIGNRKAESRMITPWLFFVLGIVGVAIVAAVTIFFSAGIDIKIKEASAMSDKIIYGISDNGYLKDNVLSGNYDLLSESGISNLSMNNGLFYLNVTIYSENKTLKNFVGGNRDFEIQCRLNGDKLAKCYERKFMLSDRVNLSKIYTVRILTGSNNNGV